MYERKIVIRVCVECICGGLSESLPLRSRCRRLKPTYVPARAAGTGCTPWAIAFVAAGPSIFACVISEA